MSTHGRGRPYRFTRPFAMSTRPYSGDGPSSNGTGMEEYSELHDLDILSDEDEETREPDMYRVVLHNDHYTTMDFVVEVIIKVFHKPVLEATQIMMDVHRKGRGLVGVYTRDIAETKCARVLRMAREREFPLKCTVERDG